jgi:hypoxia-inducible factor (prolyl hydroxylase)
MQVTCYPGNGARYVKHVDDPHGSRGRVLTLIAYSNPQWEPGHGGALRLHVPSGARDVEPRDRRLVLFWSDARAPHEVLPAHRERYAVSVWFSDAQAVAAGAASK